MSGRMAGSLAGPRTESVTLRPSVCSLYSWDMRQLRRPLLTHKDHVSAVIDVDYSPTGREFVSGGYDKTLRIFNSREVSWV